MSTVNQIETLEKIVADMKVDAAKFDGGNSAAGTRVRAAAQHAKGVLSDIRKNVQDIKNSK